MKFKSTIPLLGIFWLCLVTCVISGNFNEAKASSFVNPNVILQENFHGWGTSLAWWADVVGGMEAEVVEHVVDALFSPSKLNLNVVRYVIGGTTPNNYTCGEYRAGAASESFKDGPDSQFVWDRDPRQRKILELVKARGANTFEAFSNTPPQWLTISGCSKGNPRNPPLHSNLDPSNAPLFADYATEVIKHFHEVHNITFTSYSPFNEPFGLHGIGSWAGEVQSQEGCNMNTEVMVSVIRSMHEAIVAKNLSFVKIAVSDETQVNTQIQSLEHFINSGVSDLFSQVNVHGYWDNVEVSRKDLLNMHCAREGLELWMDEMGWAGTPAEDMKQGMEIATRIINDFRTMLPSAWVYWQAVEDVGAWGLLDVPFTNTTVDRIRYNSGYFALQQFSQHIKKGYVLIYVSDENSIAAYSKEEQKLVIVTVNSGKEEKTEEIDLTLFDSIGPVTLFRTSAAEHHINLPPPTLSPGKTLEISFPPNSISTLEFSNVILSRKRENLISNGNFENVTEGLNGQYFPVEWTSSTLGNGGGRLRSGATKSNPRRGEFSGLVELGPTWTSGLVKNFTLEGPQSSKCLLYLSFWSSSKHAGTGLEVYIYGSDNGNETTLVEVPIERNVVYKLYGTSFEAKVGDEIKILFFGSTTALLTGEAKIDDVVLHSECN